ncbi:unnamed protein product [Phytomonas sp. EM1]|nr:unnamed protein product [Phytomonas sp. EM1]|eukprot:CCW64791.1 unnamed protein product [Phytomonas sp. isolate EM1]
MGGELTNKAKMIINSRMPFPRRRSQRGNFKGRLRRSLLVGVIGVLLILLWLYYAGDSRRIPFTPSVLPPGGTQDMFLRPTGTRMVVFVMSDRIDDALCYSAGSAYLNGLPVVMAGYRMPFRGLMSKFDFMEAAIENAELQPEDVIIAMDSDTIFTGVDINPFLDRFIARSAPTPELRCVCVWKRE